MTSSTHEQIRIDRNLMTVAAFDGLVQQCLGETALLCIAGGSQTGKSWAARDWVASHRDDIEPAAYIDCLRSGLGVRYSMGAGGGLCMLRSDDYPRYALDGVDIVVIDEPARGLPFVQTLVTLVSPIAGAAAHRLVVLLLQDVRLLRAFSTRKNCLRCFDTHGTRIGAALP